ncbi:response regulator transcription factor [Streptomyces scopuliridis]|uniref:Response regulator transcription factor n=1 Tax=Streptomyces scopuliridis TaxID=452529 RepID=A0ACD4ZNS1_9ACTN|nr:response regulator transcription factor [Streptomyces scopuliridis]WSB35423.1 response regulator transcription factor [Streptomyces scopuliridis]WSB99656.1 response regulator transcription factor [Streptomyces scopuliridis]WSC06645.1 response regulator transcription factor [Streptomyces scopuliridis]
MVRIRVLVVDDHRIFAESLAAALAAESDVDVSAAGSGPAALRCLERAAAEGRRFDVMLVDADLGTVPGAAGGSVNGALNGAAGGSVHGSLNGSVNGTVGGSVNGTAAGPGAASGSASASAGGPVQVPVARAVPDQGEVALVDGISLVAGVRSSQPSVRTVVLAEKDDPHRAAQALQAGASGWVAKDCSLQRLLAVMRGVLRDETHLPPALLTGVLRELTAARKHRTESERLVESLTPREREVLRCMVAGLGRKAVAERLFLSPHTVRTHMQNVLGKLGVHSTLAAVALARRAGVGPVDLVPPLGNVVERGGQLA